MDDSGAASRGGRSVARGRVKRPSSASAPRPPTMRDIAIATGVSRSTVSRVLNDSPLIVPIAPETRARILAAARDLDYRPNPLARGLRGAPTMLLGAIVRDITDPFFAVAIEAVSRAARDRGYNIVLGHAHSSSSEALELAAVLEARQCDAILLLGDMGDQPRLLADLHDSHVPVVTMWQGSVPDRIPGVQVDNRLGTRLAIEHLAGLGHRDIAFIGGRPLGDIRERQSAYEEAMAPLVGELPADYIRHEANTPARGEAALVTLMRLPRPPTAIVASTDVLALGVLRAAIVHGIRVPGDVSVVGFDDIPMAQVTVPALTTVRMPTEAMTEAAIRLAVERGGGATGTGPSDGPAGATEEAPLVAVFPPTLVVRDSTAAPRTWAPPRLGVGHSGSTA
jgi:DNA-binding LacI/PurR family transcriptional regulator